MLSVGSLLITASKLDLTNNDMILTATAATTVGGYITSAFNHGSWTGDGLTSNTAQADLTSAHKTAIGYATASSIGATVFDGQLVAGSDVLVRFTYSGDANLDGTVNALDFNALAGHFGMPATNVWSSGDFNYDGLVNTADFTALAANFGSTLPLAAPALGGALVPEPAVCGIVAVIGLIARRRKRNSIPSDSLACATDHIPNPAVDSQPTAKHPSRGRRNAHE
jgi:hypothetical protein